MINRPEYLKAETECNKNYLFHFLPSFYFVMQATSLRINCNVSYQLATKIFFDKQVACRTTNYQLATKIFFDKQVACRTTNYQLATKIFFDKQVACRTTNYQLVLSFSITLTA